MTTATLTLPTSTEPSYLKSRRFDFFFVYGIPAFALLLGAYVLVNPHSFTNVLYYDLLLLGYHHVISTYTRLVFDVQSAKEHWLLLIPLPIAVAAAVTLVAINWGVAAIATIYLYWQWYHYTRQSEGINKAFGFKTRSAQAGSALLNRIMFYLVPVAAILMLSARPGNTFLFQPVHKLPVPMWLALGVMAVTAVCLLCWLVIQGRAVWQGSMSKLHFSYLCSHHLIYLVAYVAIQDMTVGWLVINIWHNMQYIAFVWLFNVNKHKAGFDRSKPVISWLSQERNWLIYLIVCLLLTSFIYDGIALGAGWFSNLTTLSLLIIVYQTINFHHYIVDSRIWKLRSPKVRALL
jgi:hypothetical protein